MTERGKGGQLAAGRRLLASKLLVDSMGSVGYTAHIASGLQVEVGFMACAR
jgi:hypothetical protein